MPKSPASLNLNHLTECVASYKGSCKLPLNASTHICNLLQLPNGTDSYLDWAQSLAIIIYV
jgi:hypothetical protein